MATFGQGINPQLGAIDYSPILRGSMAGAQMAAQGSQMIGQGLANLGQEVGKGIQEYTKKKEERDMYSTGIESKMNRIGAAMQRFAEHPEEFGGVAPVSKEEYEKYKAAVPKWGGGSIGTLKSGYAEISALEDRVQKAPEVALRNLNLVAARNDQEQTRVAQQSIAVGLAAMAAGVTKNPLEAIRAAGYDVNEKVASYFANLSQVGAQTRLAGSQANLADATAIGKANPPDKAPAQYYDVLRGLIAKFKAENQGREPSDIEKSGFQFQAARASGTATKTPAEEGQSEEQKQRVGIAIKYNQEIVDSAANSSQIEADVGRALELLNKVETGALGELKVQGQRLAKDFGMDFGNPANAEELRSILGSFVLNKLKLLKGTITDKDLANIEAQSASILKTPEGNAQILQLVKNMAVRSKILSKQIREGRRDKKLSEFDIMNNIQDYAENTPFSISNTATPVGSRFKVTTPVN
jgi:hypothetical protein